jgi:hypothetical protein
MTDHLTDAQLQEIAERGADKWVPGCNAVIVCVTPTERDALVAEVQALRRDAKPHMGVRWDEQTSQFVHRLLVHGVGKTEDEAAECLHSALRLYVENWPPRNDDQAKARPVGRRVANIAPMSRAEFDTRLTGDALDVLLEESDCHCNIHISRLRDALYAALWPETPEP